MNNNDIKYKNYKIRKTTKILIFIVFITLIIVSSLVLFNVLPTYALIIPVLLYLAIRTIYFKTTNKNK